jgi:hypoxanthine phosphoribosyltransferase
MVNYLDIIKTQIPSEQCIICSKFDDDVLKTAFDIMEEKKYKPFKVMVEESDYAEIIKNLSVINQKLFYINKTNKDEIFIVTEEYDPKYCFYINKCKITENVIKNIDIINISWENNNKLCYQKIMQDLLIKIKQKSKVEGMFFDAVCGIPRGGLVAATAISHMLNIPYIEWGVLKKTSRNEYIKILFVDDIVHSGDTFYKEIKSLMKENDRFVVLVKNELCPNLKELWESGMEVSKNAWVNFPWEKQLTLKEVEKIITRHVK